MPSLRVGSVRTCAHKKVVVLKTGVKDGEEDAVVVAPLIRSKSSGGPGVEVRDRVWGVYRVLVGQASTVRVKSLVTVWTGPDYIGPDEMKAVLQEAGK
ncbi:hypothetical protein ACFWN2_12840 [Lentzea sp. NPDC058436]|uniref:hypothetical protein n=1 Tax=Lentzea sp. NPDC058436 TaxID=3346499 RepID=UPI00364A6BBE